jgi:asparaginyl-tRNA synthetase
VTYKIELGTPRTVNQRITMSEQQAPASIVGIAQEVAGNLASTLSETLNLSTQPETPQPTTSASGESTLHLTMTGLLTFLGQPVLYIDEKAGSDSATGAELSPFQTPLAAYQSLSPATTSDSDPTKVATFMIRKPDSVERNEWVEMTTSARKKLVKGIEGWRKKEAKAAAEGDRVAKEQKDSEEREKKRREEAKGIVLVDDESKGSAKKVRASHSAHPVLTRCLGQDLPSPRTRR